MRHRRCNNIMLFSMSEKSIEDSISIHNCSINAYNTYNLDGLSHTHFTYSIDMEIGGIGSFVFEIVHNIDARRTVTRLSKSKNVWNRGVASDVPRDPENTGMSLSERQIKTVLSRFILQKRYDLVNNRL